MRNKSFSSRHFSRGIQISESSVKMLIHSTSSFTFGVKQNHKLIDCLVLNETFGCSPSCSRRASCLPRTMARKFLSISSEGDFTTFLGKLCHRSDILMDFRCSEKTSYVSVLCPFFCHWVALRAWVHFLCTLPSDSLARSSLFTHSDLPTYLVDFVFLQMEPELAEMIFKH